MYEVPKCLSRRHELLDEILKDLTNYMSDKDVAIDKNSDQDDAPRKLVCTLWNMITQDPPCEGCPHKEVNPKEVNPKKVNSKEVNPKKINPKEVNPKEVNPKEVNQKEPCINVLTTPCNTVETNIKSKSGQSETPQPQKRPPCRRLSKTDNRSESVRLSGSSILADTTQRITSQSFGGTKKIYHVYNQQESVRKSQSFDRNCELKIEHLVLHQNRILDQINDIEKREKEGFKMLQEADAMWTRMENAYKDRIQRTKDNQLEITQHLTVLEENTRKWKTTKKDLDFEVTNIVKIKEALIEEQKNKKKKLRAIENEITNAENKIETNQKQVEAAERSFITKQSHADTVADQISAQISKLSACVNEETKIKAEKEKEGQKYMDDAREDLQKIWKLLLSTKFKNEDLRAEKENLQKDVMILKTTHNDCKERCTEKKDKILEELSRIESEINNFKIKCTRCDRIIDTNELAKFCTDCPICLKQRECLLDGTTCSRNPVTECVCTPIKQKFILNVIENMSANLQKLVEEGAGTAVGEVVLKCLERSQNGKLDAATKKILQDFILTTVRKHLNVTIVGGAMKTRCEMDFDTYDRLMMCVHNAKIEQVATEDKSTFKQRPCKRWKDGAECNCPRGPKECVCVQKAPFPRRVGSARGCAVYPVTHTDRDEVKKTKIPSAPPSTRDPSATRDEIDIMTDWRPEPCNDGVCSGGWKTQDPSKPIPSRKQKESPSQDQSVSNELKQDIHKASTGEHQQKVRYSKTKNQKDTSNSSSDLNDSDATAKYNRKHKTALSSEHTIIQPDKSSIGQFKKRLSRKQKKRQKKKSKTSEIKENEDVIELTRTPSGNPAMAFDENMIKKINLKLNESPDMQVQIRKLENDRFILEFNSDNNDNCEVAKVRRTPSGNLVMDASKKIIATVDKKEKNISNDSVLQDGEREAVKLCVKTEDGETTCIEGMITRSPSGKIHIDLQNATYLKEFFNTKIPIVEVVTDSGTHKLDITSIAVEPHVDNQDIRIDFSSNLMKPDVDSANFANVERESKLEKISQRISRELGYLGQRSDDKIAHVTDSAINSKLTQNLKLIGNNSQKSQTSASYSSEFHRDEYLTKISKEIAFELSYVSDYIQSALSLHSVTEKYAKADQIGSKSFLGKVCKKIEQELGLMGSHHSHSHIHIDEDSVHENTSKKRTIPSNMSNKIEHELNLKVEEPNHDPSGELHKIRVKGIFPNELFEPPAVLRRTLSGNYVIVMDKEFDKICRRSISENEPNNDLKISVTKSGHYINIDLDNQNESYMCRGMLTKTSSGNLKILLSNKEDLTLSKEPKNDYKVVGKNKINEAFETILCKMFYSNVEPVGISKLTNHVAIACDVCDGCSLDNKTNKTKENAGFLLASSKQIKKSESGVYNLVLDQNSKQKFIEDIKIIVKNSQGFVPITREDTGEIKITFNQKDTTKDIEHLRVTPSGNIYLLVNDQTVEGLTVEKDESKTKVETPSKSESVENVEVSVGTFCNANCEHDGCDANMCHCKELLKELHENCCVLDYKTASIKNKQPVKKLSNPMKNNTTNNGTKTKPCNHHANCECSVRAFEQWLCMTSGQDFQWENKHEIVSNDFVDISSLCDKEVMGSKSIGTQGRSKDMMNELFWKHIEDLPPLLPTFLRN